MNKRPREELVSSPVDMELQDEPPISKKLRIQRVEVEVTLELKHIELENAVVFLKH